MSTSKHTSSNLRAAYLHCLTVARLHYENFPVASLLVPRKLRKHIAAVYAFARFADDIADESDESAEARLEDLHEWRVMLSECVEHESDDPVFLALGDTLRRFTLPVQFFHDLLDAFEQDIVQSEYADFEEVLEYCRRSANPVGRILLALFGCLNARTAVLSDALCTGLQLANFWQDVSIDIRKPRVYIPQEDMQRFGVTSDDLHRRATPAVQKLMAFEVERSREYFTAACALFPLLPFRLRLELKAVWSGGRAILDKIEALQYRVTTARPSLNRFQTARILTEIFSPIRKQT